MEFNKLMNHLSSKQNGSFRSLTWERELKTRKGVNACVVKRTSASAVRFGVTYDNMGVVQKGREDGALPAQNAGLRGMEWSIPNLVLKSVKTGKTYVRVSCAQNSKFNTEYFLNGRKVEKSEIEPLCLKSEFSNHERLTVFNVGIENVLSVY